MRRVDGNVAMWRTLGGEPALAEPLALTLERDLACTLMNIDETDRLIREANGEYWAARFTAEGDPDATVEERERAEAYMGIAAIDEYQLSELKTGLQAGAKQLEAELAAVTRRTRAAAIVRHAHVPVLRARTAARPRERRERRTRRRSSSSGDESRSTGDSDGEPPAVGGRVADRERRAA